MKSYHYANLRTSKNHQDLLFYIILHPLCTNRDLVNNTASIRPASDINDINHSLQDMESDLYIAAIRLKESKNGKRVTGWMLMSGITSALEAKRHAMEMLKEFRNSKKYTKNKINFV